MSVARPRAMVSAWRPSSMGSEPGSGQLGPDSTDVRSRARSMRTPAAVMMRRAA